MVILIIKLMKTVSKRENPLYGVLANKIQWIH